MRITERGSISTTDKDPYLGGKGGLVYASGVSNGPVHESRASMILYAAAVFSLLAAAIHLWAMPEHFEE